MPQFYARPDASPAKQVEYLQVVVKAQRQKIEDLEQSIVTMRLKGQLEHDERSKQAEALAAAQRGLETLAKERRLNPAPRKRWWTFGRSRLSK
jgi:hypothetical protein